MRRLIVRIQAWWLQMQINAAELDAQVMRDEAIAAPARLAYLRSHISDLHAQLSALRQH